MAEYIQVITTVAGKEDAQKLARALVETRLAGCVQIVGPIASTYRWEDQVETAEEWLCIAKSRNDLHEELERTIHEMHPYQVPEILAVPVITGNRDYLDWLDHQLKTREGEDVTQG
jgi:periplasmic divalent cation tolerance protein